MTNTTITFDFETKEKLTAEQVATLRTWAESVYHDTYATCDSGMDFVTMITYVFNR